MEGVTRCTVVVPGRLASRVHRLAAARDRRHGVQVITIEQLTARLAGGMGQPVDDDALRIALQAVLLGTDLEEVLTGEAEEADPALTARAEMLIKAMGLPLETDVSKGLVAAEIAACVTRALSLPDVAELRSALVPEFPLYSFALHRGQEDATAGIADAIAFSPDGKPLAVIDWKSGVAPGAKVLDHYCAQLEDYLAISGAKRGLIVLATLGTVIRVVRKGCDEIAGA